MIYEILAIAGLLAGTGYAGLRVYWSVRGKPIQQTEFKRLPETIKQIGPYRTIVAVERDCLDYDEKIKETEPEPKPKLHGLNAADALAQVEELEKDWKANLPTTKVKLWDKYVVKELKKAISKREIEASIFASKEEMKVLILHAKDLGYRIKMASTGEFFWLKWGKKSK